MNFIVRSNKSESMAACRNCGEKFIFQAPFWFYAPDSFGGFCEVCVKREDPVLLEIIKNHNELLRGKSRNNLKVKKQSVLLSNQDIIELGYAIMEMIQTMERTKLTVDASHCYLSCFHIIKNMLENVDIEYREMHSRLSDFYKKSVSNDGEQLRIFEPSEEFEMNF